jgi:hypothetical protein
MCNCNCVLENRANKRSGVAPVTTQIPDCNAEFPYRTPSSALLLPADKQPQWKMLRTINNEVRSKSSSSSPDNAFA